MLKNQFVQMSMYSRRSIEKGKETNIFKSNSPQKFFKIDFSSQFVFQSITFRKSPRTDSNFASFTLVSEIRFVFHQIVSFSDLRIRSKHGVFFSKTNRFSIDINSHSLTSFFQKLIFFFNQFVLDSEIDVQLAQRYLSNRRRKSIRQNIHSSFFYSSLLIDFTFDLRIANNVLNMKLNATNFNLNSNDSDNVVKMIQIHLRSFSITIDFSQFSLRFLTQTVFIKKIQNDSFDSNDFKRTKFEKKNISFIDSERPAKFIE